MSLTAPAGGECVGITLTFDKNVCSKVLSMTNASRRLKMSDHFKFCYLGICGRVALSFNSLGFRSGGLVIRQNIATSSLLLAR